MLNMIYIRLLGYKNVWPVFLVMTLMAMLFIYLFGVGMSADSPSQVAIVMTGDSEIGVDLANELNQSEDFSVRILEEEEAIRELQNNQVISVLFIKPDFDEMVLGGEATIEHMKTSQLMEHILLEQEISQIIRRTTGINQYLLGISPQYEKEGLVFDESSLAADIQAYEEERPMINIRSQVMGQEGEASYDPLQQFFMGMILFFSLFTIVFGVGAIVEDKENRVWHRQKVTSTSDATILGSSIIVGFIMGMFQLFLMMVTGHYIFGVDLGRSWFGLFALLGGFVLAGLCLGLLISSLVQTQQQLSAFTPLIVVSTSMLGGCMWPLEIVSSPIIKGLSYITPQRYGMVGLQKVIVYGGGIGDVLGSLLSLIILSLFFFSISMILYRKQVKI